MSNTWSSGVLSGGASGIHGTSTWRLETQRLDVVPPRKPLGRGYVILSVRGKHLVLGESPIATDSPVSGENVMIFPQRGAAVIYAALQAWDDVMDGRALHQYQVRSVHYSEAQSTYTLQIVDGPVLCKLPEIVQAKTFHIRPRGNEKPKSSVLTDPEAPAPMPRRLR